MDTDQIEREKHKDYYDYKKTETRHRHQTRRLSMGDYNLTSKQLLKYQDVMQKDKEKRLNHFEKESQRRKLRKQLGLQHRKLQKGWTFLHPIRRILPRRVSLNNHIPDYIYYFCSLLIILSSAMNFGMKDAIGSFEEVLVKLEAITVTPVSERHNELPLLDFNRYQYFLHIFFVIIAIAGMYFFLRGMKKGHWFYFFSMLGGIIIEVFLGYFLSTQNNCSQISVQVEKRLSIYVRNYYDSGPGIDEDGRKVLNSNETEFMTRTYTDAIFMDKIQRHAGCCGVNGFKDYFNKPYPTPPLWKPEVPQSCCSPIWNLNPYCAKEIPVDPIELKAKIELDGCKYKMYKICENSHRILSYGYGSFNSAILHFILFVISCLMITYQLRQIRQLERPTHFHIPEEAASRSLPVSEHRQKDRLVEILTLDPDDVELDDKILDRINKARKQLGLGNLGKKVKAIMALKKMINVVEPPHVPILAEPIPIKKQAKENKDFESRIDIFDLKKLKPYYKGLFSATYAQENKAAQTRIFSDLKEIAGKYHNKTMTGFKKPQIDQSSTGKGNNLGLNVKNIVEDKQKSSEGPQEQKSTYEDAQEQKSTSEDAQKQKSTSEDAQEQKSTSEDAQEQKSSEGGAQEIDASKSTTDGGIGNDLKPNPDEPNHV